MAIGNSLDRRKLLSESLKVILRKLDGLTAGVFGYGDPDPLFLTPRRGLDEAVRSCLSHVLSTGRSLVDTPAELYDSHSLDDGRRHCYVFHLPDSGWLVLTRHMPLDDQTLRALAPICEKLATSLRSCAANQELIEKERNLAQTLTALCEAQSARDQFLANMSHEIRTPLNGIMGFLDLFEQTRLTAEQRDYLGTIRHSSSSLLGIINDILDFSKNDAGMLQLEQAPLTLHDTLSAVVRLFARQAEAQGTRLYLTIDPRLPRRVLGDALRLKQIVSNLISNAVKFTENGTVEVRLDLLDQQSDRCALEISVRDTGIGMTQEMIDRIGQPFAQADSSTTRRYGGSGLGLAICKQLVSMMGGELEIDSQPGRGTTMGFRWQTRIAEETVAVDSSHGSPTAPKPLPSGIRHVLVVEDNPVNQKLMKAVLSKMGLEQTLAANGAEAVAAFENQDYRAPFDVILMDISMPVMDGLEATRRIRMLELESSGRARTPVIALTANALNGDRERFLAEGMDEMLTKPLDLRALNDTISRIVPNQANDPTEE
ncbi:MAG: ATP-binding protein [Planctomycetota bacterium]|uniref:ATP-binding protein n=1 Tax=Guyparkeria sp. TaxID=2035736 RepID=UPI003970F51E